MQTAQDILDTWFRDEASGKMDVPQGKRWFMGGKALDDSLTAHYSDVMNAAGKGHLDDWLDSPEGTLALIVLMDQFNRNINRGTAAAFALDSKALRACKHALANGYDTTLPITQRVFCYLPLEHDETFVSQSASVELFRMLTDIAPPELEEFTRSTLEYALDHQAIIERFGRYPHRNAVLGRTSSPEEIDWLEKENKRFGQ